MTVPLPPTATRSEILEAIFDGMEFGEAMRLAAGTFGYKAETVTVNGSNRGILDIRDPNARKKTAGESAAEKATPFGRKAMRLMREAASTYELRNSVYKDNFLVVGRVMEALFPNGAPRLHDASDFNRWHIFELVIVKLTRYVANWDDPDKDSLVDMIPYLAILGAQDEDLREAIEKQREEERANRPRTRADSNRDLRREDSGPNYEADSEFTD